MRIAVLICLLASSVHAGEYAVLASGARLRCERHEADSGKLRLYDKSGGYSEIAAAAVTDFETEEYTPPAVVGPTPAPASVPIVAVIDFKALVDDAADRYGLPRRLVHSVVRAESDFQPHAVSPKGAIGLMQLMPATAAELGADPHDPAQNVDAGTRYLRDLLVKYDGGLYHALAAYNAGPAAVDRYQGVPPYRETVGYVRRIARDAGFPTN